MADRSLFIPDSPRNFGIRPLNKGMVGHLPSNAIDDAALLVGKNVWVNPSGIKRRGAFYAERSEAGGTYPRLQDIGLFYESDGTQVRFVIDDKFLYEIGASSWTGKYWTYTTGTITATSGSTTVSGSGTTWDGNDIKAGDKIVLDADGSGNGPETCEIASIDSDTQITVKVAPTSSHAAGSDYAIRRAFGAANPYLVDWCMAKNRALFADAWRELYTYDGSTFEEYTNNTYIPTCVAYWKNRVWIGRTTESGADERNRIRWSDVDDNTSFQSANWRDLMECKGAIRRLIPNGNLMHIYFSDGIYIGRPAVSPYPINTQKIETGDVGLVGMKAVTPFLDGHFFVGQDDIYYISQANIERIGTPIVAESIEQCEHKWRIYAAPDPRNSRVVFGFPGDSEDIEKIWSFNYKSKAWSYDEIPCTLLANLEFLSSITWGTFMDAPYETGTVDITSGATTMTGYGTSWSSNVAVDDYVEVDYEGDGTYSEVGVVSSVDSDTQITVDSVWSTTTTSADYRITSSSEGWSDITYPTWGSITETDGYGGDLYLGQNLYLYRVDEVGDSDKGTDNIPVEIVTKDFDHGMPDEKKIWTRFSLKTKENVDADVVWHIYGSVDRGSTWKTLTPDGGVTLSSGDDEVKVNFRLKGSTARFKLVSTSVVDPWTISEIVLRARGGGLEVQGRDA